MKNRATALILTALLALLVASAASAQRAPQFKRFHSAPQAKRFHGGSAPGRHLHRRWVRGGY
jgi:hypothetical protein